MSSVYVKIIATKGSTPRDAGTVMSVTVDETRGTIGGGALEHSAIAKAREMLRDETETFTQTIPLGANLGQCCGGVVTLQFDRQLAPIDLPQFTSPLPKFSRAAPLPLWIWGAGHVGRAVVGKSIATQAFDITWIDSSLDRFPETACQNADVIPTNDMPRLTAHAPQDAHHLILTYSHDIDLALCAALLKRGFASCGLIGSHTKRARFGKRLRAMGLEPGHITCPIGDKNLGKHPELIAYGTIKALLAKRHLEATA